jgi:hypothetical protein
MLHICSYGYFSTNSYVTESNCLFMFRCEASTRALYVYVLVACSSKSKFIWYSLVDYWVCHHMFRSKGMKEFPRVAWPGL